MTQSKMRTALGLSIIEVTKFLMNYYHIDQEAAYKKLLQTELYELLKDLDTRLYLESNEYLCEACKTELEKDKDALYEYINQE